MVKLKTVTLPSVISCENISMSYRQVRALEDINAEFSPGTLTALVGPNGGGKSTLLKAFAGLHKIDSGSLKIEAGISVAYLPQTPDIDRSFPITVGDVVGMGLCPGVGFFKAFSSDDLNKIHTALTSVGLPDHMNRPIHCLSGGQFQRVLFARISLQNAKIILLDEPFAAIDGATMDILASVLKGWQTQGKTIITVLHDMEVVRDFFPTTLILARHLIASGPTSEVLTRENLKTAKLHCMSWDNDCETEIRQTVNL